MYKTFFHVNLFQFRDNEYSSYEYESELDFVPQIGMKIIIGNCHFKVRMVQYDLKQKWLSVFFEDYIPSDKAHYERMRNSLEHCGMKCTGGGTYIHGRNNRTY